MVHVSSYLLFLLNFKANVKGQILLYREKWMDVSSVPSQSSANSVCLGGTLVRDQIT